MLRLPAVLGGQTITSLRASQDAVYFIYLFIFFFSFFTCLFRLVRYCSEVIRHYLYLEKGKGKRRTSTVGNYGNETKNRGMIKIEGPRQEEMDLPVAVYYDKSPGE